MSIDIADRLSVDLEVQDLLFREARTANSFTDEPVSPETIAAVHDLVRWGPTAMNIQPLRVLEVRSPEARERLGAAMAEGNRAKTVAAPLVLVFAADARWHEHLPLVAPNRAEMATSMEENAEARRSMADFNATLQIGYWIAGLRAAGLAVGPMKGFDGPAIDAAFFGGTEWQTLLVANVGHPAADAFRPRQPRLEADQALRSV